MEEKTTVQDAAMGPKEVRSTVLSIEQEAACVAFRKHTLALLMEYDSEGNLKKMLQDKNSRTATAALRTKNMRFVSQIFKDANELELNASQDNEGNTILHLILDCLPTKKTYSGVDTHHLIKTLLQNKANLYQPNKPGITTFGKLLKKM